MKDSVQENFGKTPNYDLVFIKRTFNAVDKLNMTVSAMQGQYKLGFSDQEVIDVIQSLTNADFYKSMLPKHPGFAAGQDVYKPVFKGIKL